MLIAKQVFLAGCTCETQAWLMQREEAEEISPGTKWSYWTGQEIGRVAREQLGDGRLLSSGEALDRSQRTRNAMDDPQNQLLFEATFLVGDFVARADALRRTDLGWELIEVKSGVEPEQKAAKGKTGKSSVATQPKQEYLLDMAYTLFVARASGVAIARCTLMLMSRQFRHGSEEALLVEIDVSELVEPIAREFAAMAPGIAQAVLSDPAPPPEYKYACRECPYFGDTCIGREIPDPLWVLPRIGEKKFDALKEHVRVANLPPEVELTVPQRRVFDAVRTGTASLDPAGLMLLDQIEWPAFFLDFEAIMPALPWFPGTAPYVQLPFQFSIDVQAAPGADTVHHEYLAPIGGDWRRDLAESLLNCLGEAGSIVVYSSYERQTLSNLAAAFPDLEPRLAAVKTRLFDLERVILEGYCHPGFQGRTSIKNVLPVMVPDLSYDQLSIRGGEDAAGSFALMWVGETPLDRHDEKRASLLRYCALDTMAMVRVHDALRALRERKMGT